MAPSVGFRSLRYTSGVQVRSGTGALYNKKKAGGVVIDSADGYKLKFNANGVIASAISSLTIPTDTKVLVASAAYTTNVVPATITGFSWPVVPGTYSFEVNLPATMTTNGGLTVEFVLTTAVLTSIQYQTYAATASDNTTGVSTQGTTTTSATKVFDSKTAAYTLVNLKGTMVVGTGGTFAWAGCQNTSHADTTTLLLGAFARLTRVL